MSLIEPNPNVVPWSGRFAFFGAGTARVLRWYAVGLLFIPANAGILFTLVSWLKLPVFIATLISEEACVILRFLVNDRWIFSHPRPAWRRFAQYQAATAFGSAIWWLTTNILSHMGVHYMVAAILAIGVSNLVGLTSNFLWVWRRKHPSGTV